MLETIDTFRSHILEGGVLDPEGLHHEFVSGMHGQKIDFDTIPTYVDKQETIFSPLYDEWVQVNTDFIQTKFPDARELMILGVANGTNRLAVHTAHRIGKDIFGLESRKDSNDSKKLDLSPSVKLTIATSKPSLVVVVEDVGTTGSNSVQVATKARELGANDVVVLTTWQRREHLERLDEAGIEYRAIIDEPLPTYNPEDCAKTGFCARGWEFIPRVK